MNTTPTDRALEKIWRRLQMAFGLARIKTGLDGGAVQKLQIQLTGQDLIDDTPRVAEYGFTSMPRPGCQAVVIFVAGDRSNGLVIGTSDEAARLKNLLPGEVAIYDDQGQSVYITRAGIVIRGGGKPITLTDTPLVTVESDLQVTGDIRAGGDITDINGTSSMADMRAIYDTHDHNETGTTTSVPNQQI